MADKVKQAQDAQKKMKTVVADLRKVCDKIKAAKKEGATAKGGSCEDQWAAVVLAAGALAAPAGGVALSVALAPETFGVTLLGLIEFGGAVVLAAGGLGLALKQLLACLKSNNDPKQRECATWLKQVEDLRAKLARENDAIKKLK
jgi:hypothetical protein